MSNPLPFLPGYNIAVNQKTNFHKSHKFDVSNGIRVDLNREHLAPDQRSANTTLLISQQPKDYKAAIDATHATPEATMSRLPAWVAYDRKVLRFFGYFKEAVHASSQENWRVRKCVIYFYLEDDSIHIAEPKIENSGIPQGVFVKRHRIPSSDNQYIGMQDLYVGAELAIYGRVFRLVDADVFTRDFYAANGTHLADAEHYPLDPFTKKHTYRPHTHHKLMNPLKQFMEASLGKPMSIGIEATQKFLQNDGKVLRFYCQWKDEKMYGEKKPYILHYFLADDTVEVLEIQQPNSGRDPFPSLLKRQRLPKNFTENSPDVSRIGLQTDTHIRYYTDADFRVGGTVEVYGRQLFICGADAFTEDYYIRHYDLTHEDFPRLNMDEEEVEVPKMTPPPHNGFGAEEDSLGSFLYLMPKVPKQDFKKLMENDGVNMRFMAKFVNPRKEDRDRRFIVTFYLNNDTLGIFEKFERNSGFIAGKFLERARVKNVATGEYFKPTDFWVGNVIEVNKYPFELIECDEYTQKLMKANPQIFTVANAANQSHHFEMEKLQQEQKQANLIGTQ